MSVTQKNRLIAIETPLGPDVLLLRGFTGHEAMSRLFSFELDLLSTDPEIKFEEIIGQKVTIRVILGSDTERYFNGVISRFMQTGSDTGLANYRATMVPALWFLTRTADCRIFQNKKVPDIIQEIFKENGLTDVETVFLKATYEPRDYCVQYRETDFNFVSRLMEQYGIFYFFEHKKDKHTVVLADDLSAHQPCPEQPKVSWSPQGGDYQDEDVIASLQWEETFRFGKYAVTDYNYETPSTSLRTEVKSQIDVGGNSKYEIYDYPGEYKKKSYGDGIAKIRMEEEEAQYKVISGAGSARVFTTGYKFTLQDYVRKEVNGDYVLTQVQHVTSVGNTYTAGTGGGGNEDVYSNSFSCIPAKRPFRSPQVTPKPMVQGPQTAVVVGKKGEEIWTDKYGRVKVQFHWDRYGKMNEDSSCWVRVSQNWAGKKWGAMFLPRIGQEVIVEFLEGDPDRPIITGGVYNAEQMPPYELPAEQTKSTIKTNSSKGGKGFNEIRFEDKKGEEQIFIHGEKNVDIRVKQNTYEWVGYERHLIVCRDQVENVHQSRHETVGGHHVEQIEKDRHLWVKGKEAIKIGESCSLTVKGDVIEQFKANHSEQTSDDYYLKATNIVIQAMNNITLKVGSSYIAIEAGGITISTPAEIEVKGAVVSVKADAALSLKAGADLSLKAGAQAAISSDGMVAIKGSIVMIN